MKQKSAKKQSIKTSLISYKKHITSVIAVILILVFTTLQSSPFAWANSIQQQINQLTNQNAQTQNQVNTLQEEAVSLEDKISRIQQEIDGLQIQINDNQAKINELQVQINEAEAELEKQKDLLGKNIRAMYVEGDISTLEMLASSNSLSDFVDREQYRNAVKDKIKITLDTVNELKHQLKTQHETLERRLNDQNTLQAKLRAQRSESTRLLGLNTNQRIALDGEIRQNNKKIEELKRQQAIENARLFGGGTGVIGGGGYPWGNAYCLHTGQVDGPCWNYDWAFNGSIWNWSTGGYGYRNCTDWVAWRVKSSGRFMPSGMGNAKNWVGNGQARGYAVNNSPAPGAAAVSTAGFYGHVMYVEAVNGDGSVVISDYNRAGTGKYDISTISAGQASTLWYVHL